MNQILYNVAWVYLQTVCSMQGHVLEARCLLDRRQFSVKKIIEVLQAVHLLPNLFDL